MKDITFHEAADKEMSEAARYYEARSPGLGFSFLMDIEAATEQIASNPHAYEMVGRDIRRKLLGRFPYSILYAIEPDRIRIVAVAHHRRQPHYWRSRL